jgi:hypothetical protein
MSTGYEDYGWLNTPGVMVVLHISQKAAKILDKIVKKSGFPRTDIISSMLNAAYDNSEIGELQDTGSYNVYCSVFEDMGLAIVFSVFGQNITALMVSDTEALEIDNALEMGRHEIQLDGIRIVIGNDIKPHSFANQSRFSIN